MEGELSIFNWLPPISTNLDGRSVQPRYLTQPTWPPRDCKIRYLPDICFPSSRSMPTTKERNVFCWILILAKNHSFAWLFRQDLRSDHKAEDPPSRGSTCHLHLDRIETIRLDGYVR